MNERTKEYIKLMPVWKLAQDIGEPAEDLCCKLDELWHSFSEEEIEWVEANWKDADIKVSAPSSLNLVDVKVTKKEFPRVKG